MLLLTVLRGLNQVLGIDLGYFFRLWTRTCSVFIHIFGFWTWNFYSHFLDCGPEVYRSICLDYGPEVYRSICLDYGPEVYLSIFLDYGLEVYLSIFLDYGHEVYLSIFLDYGPEVYLPIFCWVCSMSRNMYKYS